MSVIDHGSSSPLVGEDRGGGRAASAAHRNLPAADAAGPHPNPPHKGEGLKRLNLPAGANDRARRLRRDMTPAERVLWRALREALPDLHWRKQVPFGPFIADFCSHRARLIIEVDGGQHAADAGDDARTRFLRDEGYGVLRFWNNEVIDNTQGVISSVAQSLEPARQ